MLDAEANALGHAPNAALDRAGLKARVLALRKELPKPESNLILSCIDDLARSPDSVRDSISTRLMESFRLQSGRATFGLLYELNCTHLLTQVSSCLRRYGSRTDPRDVLQEVFFNVYRYPHRFNCEREDAFRVWSAMIVRNTVLKHLRSSGRSGHSEMPFEDLSDQPEVRNSGPLGGAIEKEALRECGRVYLTYLHLYLEFYAMLSPREQQAINLVEVEELSYREAAERLTIKLENLKMVIFRARRKIHRSMRRVFEGLPADCRPARDPKLLGNGLELSMAGRLGGEDEDDDLDSEDDARGFDTEDGS
ncbi:MAG TPA: RNA polymerase sigma factor [Planctomycetota bacterium]|nr:RNA polymerase sigma factor [Planctomycetota bacterium]